MNFEQINQLSGLGANIVTILGFIGGIITWILYKIKIYDEKKYKIIKTSDNIFAEEQHWHFSEISYKPNIKIEDINKGRINIITNFNIK